MAAKQAAARARATAAAADELVAEALFADAQTTSGLPPSSPWADAFAADARRVDDRFAEARFAASLSEDGLVGDSSEQQRLGRSCDGREQLQQQQQQPPTMGEVARTDVVGAAASGASASALASAAGEPASRSSLAGTATAVAARARDRTSTVRNTATEAVTPLPHEATSRLVKPRDEKAKPSDRRVGVVVDGGGSSPAGATGTIANDHGNGLGTRSDLDSNLDNDSDGGADVSGAAAEIEQRQQRQWASMTVAALKEELRERGLKVSGKKAELVERLFRA